MRPLVSYDDISLPAPAAAFQTQSQYGQQPPPKKRKRTHQRHQPPPQQVQHWDDPGNPDDYMPYADNGKNGEAAGSVMAEEAEEEDGSRELTYEEIWDDSALIDAWNAATEEYETYHGPEKDWKKEPVYKSPLWYNVPSSPYRLKKSQAAISSHPAKLDASAKPGEAEGDSQPLNFDTFVPDHDPSLSLPAPQYPTGDLPDYSGSHLAASPGPMVSQDEAFTRAMGAMYWAGYYSAVYHYHRNAHEGTAQDDEGAGEEESEEDEGLVSTQR